MSHELLRVEVERGRARVDGPDLRDARGHLLEPEK